MNAYLYTPTVYVESAKHASSYAYIAVHLYYVSSLYLNECGYVYTVKSKKYFHTLTQAVEFLYTCTYIYNIACVYANFCPHLLM